MSKPMSAASDAFQQSILDADNLLTHFNKLNTKPPPPETEVLKRAGLIMAMTAWETYVEDRVAEALADRVRALNDDSAAAFFRAKLDDEVRRLHNPTSEKTIQLFRDYANVDLTEKWTWNNMDSKTVRERLNQYLKLRGTSFIGPEAFSTDRRRPIPSPKTIWRRSFGF